MPIIFGHATSALQLPRSIVLPVRGDRIRPAPSPVLCLTNPDPSQALFLHEAYRRSKVMFAAVKLGIFDRLEKSPAPLPTLVHRQLPPDGGLLIAERLLSPTRRGRWRHTCNRSTCSSTRKARSTRLNNTARCSRPRDSRKSRGACPERRWMRCWRSRASRALQSALLLRSQVPPAEREM